MAKNVTATKTMQISQIDATDFLFSSPPALPPGDWTAGVPRYRAP
jgi:hypothetical protein